MKRVVGLPGETVALRDTATILINGRPIDRPASLQSLKYYSFGAFQAGRTAECGSGYFVLGDDSKDSQDSRYTGPLDLHQIKGRAWLRVWPLSRIGFVNP
jgi:signal peptidase I